MVGGMSPKQWAAYRLAQAMHEAERAERERRARWPLWRKSLELFKGVALDIYHAAVNREDGK